LQMVEQTHRGVEHCEWRQVTMEVFLLLIVSAISVCPT
jgi:hypothetical protein